MAAWAGALLVNAIVPLMFGMLATDPVGRWGMGAAMAVVLVGGWLFCYAFPVQGRKLIAGSVLTALSQLLPIAQLVAGILGLAVASGLGLFVAGNDGQPDRFVSEFGSFVATMATGTILVAGAFVLGWIAAFVLPKHWFDASPVGTTPA
jgi:hypothetical protein